MVIISYTKYRKNNRQKMAGVLPQQDPVPIRSKPLRLYRFYSLGWCFIRSKQRYNSNSVHHTSFGLLK